MNIFSIIILIVFGVICAIIHKNKGYSVIAGFLWGFCFSIIGLIVVLLEKSKEEKEMSGNKGLKIWQWIIIFVVIEIVLIIVFVKVIMPMLAKKKTVDVFNTVNKELNEENISSFNSQFAGYVSEEERGSNVSSLIRRVIISNTTDEKNKVSIKFNNTKYSADNINQLTKLVDSNKKYSVKLEYNKSTKLVDTVVINVK